MRKKISIAAALVLVGVLGWTPSAFAHGGHGACGDGYRGYLVPVAQAGALGGIVSGLAQDGAVSDVVAGIHEAVCEPRP